MVKEERAEAGGVELLACEWIDVRGVEVRAVTVALHHVRTLVGVEAGDGHAVDRGEGLPAARRRDLDGSDRFAAAVDVDDRAEISRSFLADLLLPLNRLPYEHLAKLTQKHA